MTLFGSKSFGPNGARMDPERTPNGTRTDLERIPNQRTDPEWILNGARELVISGASIPGTALPGILITDSLVIPIISTGFVYQTSVQLSSSLGIGSW